MLPPVYVSVSAISACGVAPLTGAVMEGGVTEEIILSMVTVTLLFSGIVS